MNDGQEIVLRLPPELERELAVLMWDVREALGQSHPYDGARPESNRSSYLVG